VTSNAMRFLISSHLLSYSFLLFQAKQVRFSSER
jgi:hypothetical protein